MRWLIRLALILEVALLLLPPGMSILDARLYYGASAALSYLDDLGPSGRRGYFVHELVDLAFIVTYTLLLRRLAERWRAPSLIAFVPGAADLIETTGILLLTSVATGSHAIASVISVATPAKWLAFVLAAIVFGRARWRLRAST